MRIIPICFLLTALSPLLAEKVQSGLDQQAPHREAVLPVNPAAPVPTEARRLALETAGAFVNDGFRVRDGEWAISLAKEAPSFLQVTLFAGNRYWFVAAAPDPGARIRVTLYDESGHPVEGERWQDRGAPGAAGFRTAAGVAPERSGKYFVGMELLESTREAPTDVSLVYAFK